MIMKSRLLTPFCQRTRAVLLVIVAAACAGCPAVSSIPESPPEDFCQSRLTRLGKAIAMYRLEEGSLPPSIAGTGGSKQSWRTLIAPYLMGRDSHDFDYRPDEPWDSTHNRQQFLNWVPCKFACPLESDRIDYPFASYVMLVRADSTGSAEGARNVMPLPDDAVLVVESAGCHIEYGEPRDIDIDSLFKGDSPFGVGKLNSLHPKVVKALRVDGKVIDIPKDISKEDLRRLLAGTATK